MIAKTMGVAAIAVAAIVVSPTTAQAEPAFDVPVEVLPYIEVPGPLHDAIVGVAAAANDFVIGYNRANTQAVQAIAGLASGVLCALATGSAQPCKPSP